MFAHCFAQLECIRAELRRLCGDRKGVTALEYGIIAAVTVAAVGTVVGNVGGDLTRIWGDIHNALSGGG